MITFQLDKAQLARVESTLKGIKNGAPRAVTAALNNTAEKAKKAAVAEARSDVRLPAKLLREKFEGPRDNPRNKATFGRQQAILSAQVRGLILSRFLSGKVPATGRPTFDPKVKVKPTGKAKKIRGGFLLRLRKGKKQGDMHGIFVRNKDGGLKHLYGPSPSQILGRELGKLSNQLQPILAEQLAAEVATVLRRFGKQ